jgi:hypothetical protein
MKPLHLLFAGGILVMLASSCSKLGQIIPIPPPGVIQSLEQTPFKSYTDSLLALSVTNNVGSILTISAVALNDNTQHGSAGQDLGQAEIGYAFRSTVAGAVTSLGVLLPSTGYNHTVTLWDSASGQVLAQTDVPTLTGGKWTYVSLALQNQAVVIQPNHGYIVGFNSLAVGNAIETANPGNSIYLLDGIYQFFGSGASAKVPIIPFTRGPVTFENYYLIPYNTPITQPVFPPSGSSQFSSNFDVPGVCDIGFIPAP